MTSTRTLHGVKVRIPERWDDWSIFKYAAPKAEGAALPTATKVTQLQPNLIATRHLRHPQTPLVAVFESSNAEYMKQNPSFEVTARGESTYEGQPAVWQDSVQAHPSAGVRAHQRHIAVEGERDDEYLVLAITGEQHDVLRLSKEIGFSTAPADSSS